MSEQIDFRFPMLREALRCFQQLTEQKVVTEVYSYLENEPLKQMPEDVNPFFYPKLHQSELEFQYALIGMSDELVQITAISSPYVINQIKEYLKPYAEDINRRCKKKSLRAVLKITNKKELFYSKHWDGELKISATSIEPSIKVTRLLQNKDLFNQYHEFVKYHGSRFTQVLNSIAVPDYWNPEKQREQKSRIDGPYFKINQLAGKVADLNRFITICEKLCQPTKSEYRENKLPILKHQDNKYAFVGVSNTGAANLAALLYRLIEVKVYQFPSNRASDARFFLDFFNIEQPDNRVKYVSKCLGDPSLIEKPLLLFRDVITE
jgi:hypothetical protein